MWDEEWKYIRAPHAELYDRQSDPGELQNLAESRSDIVRRLEQKLTELESTMSRREGVRVEIDDETERALRSLGYVGGTPADDDSPGARKDPKHMVDLVDDWVRGRVAG